VTRGVESDFLILGSGVAGLVTALRLARHGTVSVVTKKENHESNTNYAQGGIATVMSFEDSFDLHMRDTLECGAGLSHPGAVESMVREGPARIRDLAEWGVDFTRAPEGAFALGIEGGHSRRRIVHSRDMTGREVERVLLHRAEADPNITFFDHHAAVDLILDSKIAGERRPAVRDRCWGAYVLTEAHGPIVPFTARATFLATGGCGKVYLYTSNPDIATGDGIAMAYRAGARVANLEFVQFHPTCLFHPEARSFLISEAVRGEGAVLTALDGDRFMTRYDPRAELAPRDIVARAIDAEMKRRGDKHVLLDLRPVGKETISSRFPTIAAMCARFGFDVTAAPIPVVPAAHYMCGGVVVDAVGRTGIPGLYGAGEVTHTGVHGANRLASNSLLEALVYAERASGDGAAAAGAARPPEAPGWEVGAAREPRESVLIDHNWDLVRRLMWDYVGIVRSDERLVTAARRIALIREEIESFYWKCFITPDLLELRNIALVGELIIRSATLRRESRGLHYNIDHLERDDTRWLCDTILSRDTGGEDG